MLPPGKSVRPQEPAKSVSPERRSESASNCRQTPPGVWPGVARTFAVMPPTESVAPSVRSSTRVMGRSVARYSLPQAFIGEKAIFVSAGEMWTGSPG